MAVESSTNVNGANSANRASGEDMSSLCYMHPSDNPGALLVPIPFDGMGYRS